MFKDIKQTEVNITKSLVNSPVAERIEGLVDMYRQVSSLLRKTEELKDRVYPEIRKQFDEVFEEQDKAVSRVLQVGNLIATISKDSVRAGSETINIEKFVEDLKTALPQFASIIERNLEAASQLTRIQVSPSLYVLNKQTSDPERLAPFLEGSKLHKFIKNPSLAGLTESKDDMAIVHGLLLENLDAIIAKIKPFMDKMYRVVRGSTKQVDSIFDTYVSQYIVEPSSVLSEDEAPENENPYVTSIKRLKSKALAIIDSSSEFADDLVDHLEGYESIADIIERSAELKNKISSELKEEMVDLFTEEERAYNNIIDLGENIVAFTSVESTRKANDKVIVAKFMELLSEAIPSATSLIEDLYIANKSISEATATKSSIKINREELSESINRLRDILGKVSAFASKVLSIVKRKIENIEDINEAMKLTLGKLTEEVVIETSEVEPTETFYCVYQKGIAVFGVGSTEEEAIASASEWIETSNFANQSTFKIAKCGKEVVDYYNINGTPDTFNVSDDGVVTL